LGDFTCRNIGSTGAIPLIVVGVAVGTVAQELVIGSSQIARIGAVSIRVIAIGFIALITMICTRKLVAIVIAVVARPIR
jgi:hypothetical protein